MSRPLGLAILGCAHIAHAMGYARALTATERATLVVVHDPDPSLGSRVADQFGVPFEPDLATALAAPGVDAVIVCSATVDHRRLVLAAAAAHLHVMVEKPIATTVADALAMIEACASAGVRLQTAFVTRFYPAVQQVRSIIASGELGELVGMVGGNRGRPPLAPNYPAWITTFADAGGGALMDHSVHVTDVMRHVSGLEATAVSAEVASAMWGIEVDDLALLSLSFERGVIGSVDPSWSVPAGNPWSYDFFLRVLGTSGALTINDVDEAIHVVGGEPGGEYLAPFGIDIDRAMIEGFVASIEAGATVEPCATGEDGLRALEIALAAYEAAARGESVTITRHQPA